MTDESPQLITSAVLDAARGFAVRHRNDAKRILIAAACGGCAGGGFVWLWRGDWGGGLNPLGWNDLAQSEFFDFIQFGAIGGAVIGLVGAVRRLRQQRQRQ